MANVRPVRAAPDPSACSHQPMALNSHSELQVAQPTSNRAIASGIADQLVQEIGQRFGLDRVQSSVEEDAYEDESRYCISNSEISEVEAFRQLRERNVYLPLILYEWVLTIMLQRQLAEATTHAGSNRNEERRQQSYTREYELEALSYWRHERRTIRNPLGTASEIPASRRYAAKKYKITSDQLRQWERNEKSILDTKKVRRRNGGERHPGIPEVGEQLNGLFLERWVQGFELTDKWFIRNAKEKYEQKYPDFVNFDENGLKIYDFKYVSG